MEINCKIVVVRRNVERVGPAYLASKKASEGNAANGVQNDDADDKAFGADEFFVDVNYLRSLDPKEWKEQDHYAVLGLEKQRYDATDDDIRRAYRRMVLQHHPDKRKAKGEEVIADKDYFTCITKAYEILGTPKTRRAYDSVDPQFDDSFPTQTDIDNKFYETFEKCFALNARWSEKKNVPSFGDEHAKREDVDEFYRFWYDFKSWREYSYLDEEDKEKGQDRDERRWIEKENKAARIKRKKEEMLRIRALVDLAYNNDKRIQKFKNEEKERKLAAKRAKMNAAQAQKAEQERAIREAKAAKERADRAEQERIEQIRMEREQQKRAIKKEKKLLRDKAKEAKYFSDNDKQQLKHMEGVEKICETFSLIELQELNKKMETSSREAFQQALSMANKKIEAELNELNSKSGGGGGNAASTTNGKKTGTSSTSNVSQVKEVKKHEMWSNENTQILIKAVNLFPAGTSQRWDVIAAFLNQHAQLDCNITARDVLNKAKSLQNSDFSKSSLKTQSNEGAFKSFEKSTKKDVQIISDITINNFASVNSDTKMNNGVSGGGGSSSVGVSSIKKSNSNNNDNNSYSNSNSNDSISSTTAPMTNGATTNGTCNNDSETTTSTTTATTNGKSAASKTWTKEEQAILEQAIRTYPISTPDRWDRIAECIPNRTKKECMRRVKELVELVNSKKEAQQSVK